MTWIPCSESLPESDTTVMIFAPDSNEPVWLGFHDGVIWRSVDAMPVKVTHWADMPDPPANQP